MRWEGHVSLTYSYRKEMRTAYKVLVSYSLRGRDHLEELGGNNIKMDLRDNFAQDKDQLNDLENKVMKLPAPLKVKDLTR
jgi:hypothetical protein